MPLFISDEEFDRCSHNVSLIAEKADSFIKDLQRQVETVKAQADAASITDEQTCSLLEQKYISLSTDFAKLESENEKLNALIEHRGAELSEERSEKHQLHLKVIGKDGEIERLSMEVSELHKSKRQLLELIEQRDLEISEKNATITSYLDKIVNFTDDVALKQACLHDREAELARSNATCARLLQEKELIEKHNVWLNEELTAKVGNLIEVRRTHAEVEADMSSQLADVERNFNECSSSLKWSKERVKELEGKLISLQEELCSSKDTAAANEDRFSAEISTVTKLVELYKESSEEWSKKAGELEGVIKALETHLSQVESEYTEKLQKEISATKLHEKEAAELKEKLDKCEAEIENYRKANELSLLPINSFAEKKWTYRSDADDIHENEGMIIPKIPVGVSGTALAASLLRDGWSLAKMYEKYQEAVDALRHESMGRKQSQAILERVLYEIEQKAEVILDERAEHERMVEAYSRIRQKLQHTTFEQVKVEGTVQELKAELRRSEREYDMAQKEIVDLQKQVTVLLKECRDIQLRYGSVCDIYADESADVAVDMEGASDVDRVISERLLTFKDINELVEQNVKLRSLVRNMSDQNEKRDAELREMYELEHQKLTDEAASKVAAVLERAEEQCQMIESLHTSNAMYKRLYEEELKHRSSKPNCSESIPGSGRKDLMFLLEDSQDASKKAHEQAVEHAKKLEEQLEKSRNETMSLRQERDKLSMESNFARERLDSIMKELEHQREEANGVLCRNVEFSQLIVDYQRKVRESCDSLRAAEELSRKLSVEVSLLKHEKELLLNAEKRACDEVRNLSERVHRLQASLDTIHSAEEVREEARGMEKRKQEEHLQQAEKDWAQMKKELQEERDNVRTLTLDREHTLQNAMRQIEDLGKQLADALHDVTSAESRAAVAESRCSELETLVKASKDKLVDGGCDPSTSLTNEVRVDPHKLKEEMEKVEAEAHAYKDHMLQYKNIAQVNEVALKQVESAHERFKAEADKMKKSLEAEISTLRERLATLESDTIAKSKEAASALADKEEALYSALADMNNLKQENSVKISEFMGMEVQISYLKENLDKEHQRWRTAQNNYERQVILQSDTIQELTKTSQALGLLQEEVPQLRKVSDTQKCEIDLLREKLASEKSVLGKLKDEAERKFNEVNAQNKILHTRLEALHIKTAEKERYSAGFSGSTDPNSQAEGDLQTVVSYLRRSKEIAETEISLLKQEKLRLQSQLERALKDSEIAQTQLHAERANSRALLFSDDDFKSLQIQVRELNLLRESNLQLREENKHNFQECQKLRELAQKARMEIEHLESMLREKKVEVDSCQKEIEMHKIEKGILENRISELLNTCKSVDLEDYNRLKDDCQQMQVRLRVVEAELDETRKLVSEKQNVITGLEQELAKNRIELSEREARIKANLQAEATLKADIERQRKVIVQVKKKLEILTKEKEELSKEKQNLSKQLEDSSRLGKRALGDTSSEQTMKEKEKEKDTRIQTLERALEREREVLRKEKTTRLKFSRTAEDLFMKVNQEKTKLVNEVERLKQVRETISEGGVPPGSQSPEPFLDNQVASYLLAVQSLEEAINSGVGDELEGGRVPPSETLTMDTSSAAALQVPAQSLPTQSSIGTVVGPSQTKTAEEREKKSNLPKPQSENRKIPRRLNRPRIAHPQEPSGDTEMSEVEGPSNAESKKGFTLTTAQPSVPSVRKRTASLTGSELREELPIQSDTSSIVVPPPIKKSRPEHPKEGADGKVSVPSQSLEAPSNLEEPVEAVGDNREAANELPIVVEKEEASAATELDEEAKESLSDAVNNSETQNNELIDTSEDLFDSLRETEEGLGEGLRDGEEHDPQQTPVETESDREEGELPSDVADDQDCGDISSVMVTSLEPGEDQHEHSSVPDVPFSAIDEDHYTIAGEVNEITSTTVVVDEKIDMDEGVDEAADDWDKSINDTGAVECEKSPKAAFGSAGSSSPSNPLDPTISDQRNIIATPVTEEEESAVDRNRTIIFSERAKEKARLRVRGLLESSITTTDSRATAPKRDGNRGGRSAQTPPGRRVTRARGGRRPTGDESQG